MTPTQAAKLEASTRLNQTVYHKEKGGSKFIAMGVVEDEVYIIVDDYKHLIQKIRIATHLPWDGSTYAYRTGYYTWSAKKHRIVWGQYTQFLTEKEYKRLLNLALL